jgi:hypothetical protein
MVQPSQQDGNIPGYFSGQVSGVSPEGQGQERGWERDGVSVPERG